MSAWGLDAEADEDSKVNSQENPDPPDARDDEADAWGRGVDKYDGEPTRSVETASARTTKSVSVNGLSKDNEQNSSHLTLKDV